MKSASWLPFAAVFPEGPPAPAHSLAEDWRTLQVGRRAAGRQAGRHESRRGMQRRRPASLGREVAVAVARAMLHTVARSSLGRSRGWLQSAKGRARERQRCLIPSLPVAVLPSLFRSLSCLLLPLHCNSSEFGEGKQREMETEMDGPSKKDRGVIVGMRDGRRISYTT